MATSIPSTDHLSQFGFLFGFPIAHSMSPMFHEAIFGKLKLNWSQLFLESTDMSLFLKQTKEPKFFGSSVTMPHKVAVMQHLDDITDEGRSVGACNTVFWRQHGDKRILVGTNTDVIGIRESFVQNVSNPEQLLYGRPGLVVGGGGAARAAVYALKNFLNCKTVYLINRDKSEVDAILDWCRDHGYGDGLVHAATAAQAETLEGAGAIVACVPDIPPVTEAEREARAVFEIFLGKQHKGAILEMAYHPKPYTVIAALAEKNKWQVILGTEAMIYQGLAQSKLWTGKTLTQSQLAEVKEVIAAELAKH